MGCVIGVHQDEAAVVEKFGKFEKISGPGCLCLPIPCICSVAGCLSTRVKQIYVDVQTKTLDNVFVAVQVAIQYQILPDPDSRYDAFYKLYNPSHQIQSMVEDVVRGAVPKIDLDNVFLEKQHIASNVQAALTKDMETYGYKIVAALVTDISPDEKVKDSMNEINANRRLRIAQSEKAEAEKMTQIKLAEAEAESTYLQGEGIARQRKAIVDGMRESVTSFSDEVEGLKPRDVFDLMMMNQYFDTLKDVAKGSQCSTVFAPRRRAPNTMKGSQTGLYEVAST
eukprot:GHVQ01002830.1.p1 GENE.GHVQ01002830.1~~GHVQ01002830.1.p1  ORF type:complete len:282 (+),score=30.35 GHVQ01002830.1:369-1214(+)